MDEQKKQMLEPQEETGEKNNPQDKGPARSYIVRILAGLYLLYTGYELCKGFITGEEGSAWWFMAAGIIFLLIAVALLISGGKYFIVKNREQKDKNLFENGDSQNAEGVLKREETPQKTMSISERANLAKHLNEEENNQE